MTIRLIRALHFDVRLHLAAFVRLLALVHICARAFARHLHPAQSQHASHQQQGQQFFHYPFHIFQVDFQLYNKKIATFSRYKVTIFFFIIQIFFLHHPPETLTLSGHRRLMSLHQQLLGHRAHRMSRTVPHVSRGKNVNFFIVLGNLWYQNQMLLSLAPRSSNLLHGDPIL